MLTWHPCPTTADTQRAALSCMLHRHLAVWTPLRPILVEPSLTAKGLLHPDLFDLHHALEDIGPTLQDEIIAAAAIDCVGEVKASRQRCADNVGVIGAAFDHSSAWAPALEVLRRAARTRHEARAAEARLVQLDVAGVAALRTAIGLLERAWPEILAELQDMVSRVLVFDFPSMLGFSGAAYHGAVFLRVEDLVDPVLLAENLLHEGSHVRLNTAMASCAYLTDDDDTERHASPLRDDPRPLFGVFHQLFVLARMTEMYRRFHARLGLSHPRHAVVRAQFAHAHRIVHGHRKLTPAGAALASQAASVLEDAP